MSWLQIYRVPSKGSNQWVLDRPGVLLTIVSFGIVSSCAAEHDVASTGRALLYYCLRVLYVLIVYCCVLVSAIEPLAQARYWSL